MVSPFVAFRESASHFDRKLTWELTLRGKATHSLLNSFDKFLKKENFPFLP
jgi:hypothetical protein